MELPGARKLIRLLAKLLGVSNTFTIVVVNNSKAKCGVSVEPNGDGDWIEPGHSCRLKALGWGGNPEIFAFILDEQVCFSDETNMFEDFEFVRVE